MTRTFGPLLITALVCLLTACGGSSDPDDHGHEHAEGDGGHAPEDHAADHDGEGGGHAHDEVSLGVTRVGDLDVELAQGHGAVTAGAEGHLVVKLPYNDGGATEVRAWIGTDDRTLSLVGRGQYAPDHDDYDVHAVAPDPLPAAPMWWVEVEQPDGTTLVGSAAPILE